jgi:hypothetical protein
MRRIIAILVLGLSLAGCGGASETDHIATATSQCTTASEFKTSGTGRLHRAYQASVGECQKVIGLTTSLRDQFMAMGMNEDQAQKLAEKYQNTHDAAGRLALATDRSREAHPGQELEAVIATRSQFYISAGTGPVGERFLVADGDDQ